MKKVNVAIIGTGTIAKKLAQAFKITDSACLYAVASRNIRKAEDFAKKHSIPNYYGSYEDAIKDNKVDLVYIALPHPFHYPVAKMSLENKKNTLCEKPVTVNLKEAQELFEIAEKNNLFFSEAMWTRFLPSVKQVSEIIKEGAIGEIKHIKGSVAHMSKNIERMKNPHLAGGMMLDCGVYLISAVQLLLGNNYSHLETKAKLSKEGVDLHSTTHIYYPEGKKASLFVAMDIKGRNKIKIVGEKGIITLKSVYNWQDVKIKTKEQTIILPNPEQKAGGFEYMTKAMCDAILNGEKYCRELTPYDTLSTMSTMDKIRSIWGLKYPFE